MKTLRPEKAERDLEMDRLIGLSETYRKANLKKKVIV